MQFYLIRHAQSENNLLYTLTGRLEGRSEDPDLTPVGRLQAEVLARFLRRSGQVTPAPGWDPHNTGGFGLTHLYCSLMLRSVATATIVGKALDLPPIAWEDAHEVGGIHQRDEATGEYVGLPGKNRAYFATHYPSLILPEWLGEEGWWNRPFEESAQRPVRARRLLRDLLDRHGGTSDRVALISHGGFGNHLLRGILDLPLPGDKEGEELWFSFNNAAISRIDFDQEGIQIHYLNRVDFLPRALLT